MIPNLETLDRVAKTLPEKAKALQARFFPESKANIDDIGDQAFKADLFQSPLSLPCSISPKEIKDIIDKQKSKGAPGRDGVSPVFLKAMGMPLAAAIASLTTAC